MRVRLLVSLTILLAAGGVVSRAAQRTVTVSAGWVKVPATGATETTAFVTVQNGTMYDVYLVGADSDVAGVVELRQVSKTGAPVVAKEITVAAYERLDMAPDGIHLHLGQLKRPLKAGDAVTLSLQLDSGSPLLVEATVK